MRFFTHEVMRPGDETELSRLIGEAREARMPIEIRGHGTKRDIGRPVQAAAAIETSGFGGVTLYEPTELVMTARSGTAVSAIEERLAGRRQMLAFEPLDLGPLNGRPAGQATVGAVFASNTSGSRRITAGAARDHLLGLKAVNGRGEVFKSGGRVLKNVTGYDLVRGLAGSWGTLAVVTEVTFKVLPAPDETRTLLLEGLHDDIATEVMCAALGTPWEVSGTLHLQAALTPRLRLRRLAQSGRSVTALRLENFAGSVAYRAHRLKEHLRQYGEIAELDDAGSQAFWGEVRELSFLQGSKDPVWRISITPAKAPKVVAALLAYMPAKIAYDWSGGLIWAEVPQSLDAGATDMRRLMAVHGGHATLMRAEASVRAAVDVFQPLDPVAQRLTRGLKATFDPAGILNPGRMYVDM